VVNAFHVEREPRGARDIDGLRAEKMDRDEKIITLTIDGVEVQAREGSTILEAAREYGIEIPTLCYHEELAPFGACRFCSVEVEREGKSRIVASCIYEVEDGLVARTDSERVMRVRRRLLALLLARCPNIDLIKDMASRMGIEPQPRFKQEKEECILCRLCRLCVRACQEIVGIGAIGFAAGGINKKVVTPFERPSNVCIGCGICAYVCPAGYIKIKDVGDTRIIENWDMEFKLEKCNKCGKYFAPEAQLDYIRKKLNLPEDALQNCRECEDWSELLPEGFEKVTAPES